VTEQHGHSILVVDDQPESSDAVGLLLEQHGIEVRIAHDGEEALAALQRGFRPCLVVVDLMMPKMDGWEFRQRQLSDPEFAGIPVLIMSGYPNADKAAGTLGVRTVLKKPLSVPRLLSLVNRHCTRDARRASTA
jgi:CheY-like chemotaxis protein